MSISPLLKTLNYPRQSSIAASLAVALGLLTSPTFAKNTQPGQIPPTIHGVPASDFDARRYLAAYMPGAMAPGSFGGDQPVAIRQVANCDDDGPGSLRAQVAAAMSGDTIDLSQLACSTITLGSEIVVLQENLYVRGPGADQLIIDGNSHSRIFKHAAVNGLFKLSDLSMVNGYYTGTGSADGGCITSYGSLSLVRSIVLGCVLHGTNAGTVRGGAVYAQELTLIASEISMSIAHSVDTRVLGGAAYVGAGKCTIKYSTISDNIAYTPPLSPYPSYAGGVYARGTVDIQSSTISGNHSRSYAGLVVAGGPSYPASIVNSTISSNVAETKVGGIMTKSSLTLFNTTIAFNTAHSVSSGAGLYAKAQNQYLYNSIIAGNGGPAGEGDLSGSGYGTPVGLNNLIVASTIGVPGDTIQACPKLEPLADNGGVTLTHALNHSSPAIDQGFFTPNLQYDQRGAPRFAGPQEDIGSVEWQPGDTDERLFAGGFDDGICD